VTEYALKTENIKKEYKVSAGIFHGKKNLKAVNGINLSIAKVIYRQSPK